jgi:Zn-dependent M16 (insulinase) family peptidase
VVGGLSDELLQSTFSIGMKGVDGGNNKAVEDLVLQTLKTLSEEGFHPDAVKASMNTIEFRLRT